ncbi:hypothetical protein QBC33DRAFT_541582 [Phialemonium atrogriseum]|uniref:Uncharacterized protein n=1 Tax=Phialemonium atrogriseum TaxID=1093897 RepID=A0AAJ0BY31_9PEZI|nr:uncharacterized protein QBC33DRAFT_541582 [Phialemonium atrogriseum]KAK1766610.1 hypothetical protein QBC33DRAFT_541582 [Phialemonium atrogriseum]
MTTIAKTIVATGVSSGLGFEAVKQLLGQAQPYKVILGARDTDRTQSAYNDLGFDTSKHSLAILPLELANLKTVRSFAQQTLDRLGQDKLDYLFLNAAIAKGAEEPGPHGSKWCEAHVVNHLSQHYLVHLLREKLISSQSRIVVVSSGAIRLVTDPSELDADLKGASGADGRKVYSETKFTQLLGALWWSRRLAGSCKVVAVSPGLVPGTALGRHSGMKLTMDMPDAKPISEGALSLLRAFTRDDFPADPEEIFLTSWGEWWGKDVFAKALDKELQDRWCPSKEDIEKEEGLAA